MRPSILSALAALALPLAVAGCSSFQEPKNIAKIERTELHFSIDQCQPLGDEIFKCAAIDKPVCSPYYNGDLECVRLGPKGSVFVTQGIED